MWGDLEVALFLLYFMWQSHEMLSLAGTLRG